MFFSPNGWRTRCRCRISRWVIFKVAELLPSLPLAIVFCSGGFTPARPGGPPAFAFDFGLLFSLCSLSRRVGRSCRPGSRRFLARGFSRDIRMSATFFPFTRILRATQLSGHGFSRAADDRALINSFLARKTGPPGPRQKGLPGPRSGEPGRSVSLGDQAVEAPRFLRPDYLIGSLDIPARDSSFFSIPII